MNAHRIFVHFHEILIQEYDGNTKLYTKYRTVAKARTLFLDLSCGASSGAQV
jgi:hypothetical protein